MLRTIFDFRRISTLMALLLIIALAALMFASAPAETQTAPSDATATPTATATGTATPTPTATADADATATPTATATGTATPTATATATGTATATPTATATVPPANADYDADDDGLIEIRTLAQLNAIRYDLDGDGKQGSVSAADWATYTTAFLNAASDMGCKLTDHDSNAATPQQATCSGYELMLDLDFDTNRDGEVNSSDTYPNWTPIGTDANKFTSTFKSNSADAIAKISNLTITSISGGGVSTEVGLFGATSATARIEGVGLVNAKVNITTSSNYVYVGALVGSNAGKVIACYSTGAITANAGFESNAGGLVGSNTGTIAASFSRATVDMAMAAGVTSGSTNIYAGGLAGHNTGTITAAYAGGAVKGKGGSGSYVGGLVGFNTAPTDATSTTKTIIASYSIAPATSVAYATTANAPTPTVGGLTGCCNDPTTTNTITASYWDYITSGVPDDADTTMPEGKSTRDLISTKRATGIYAGWNTLTIDGVNNVNPWEFRSEDSYRYPLLTYGGHTIETSGNQRFAYIGMPSRYGVTGIQPMEGMTIYSGRWPFNRPRNGGWIWETSADGITWTALIPPPGKRWAPIRGSGPTYQFVAMPDHIDKYIRAKLPMAAGDYIYTRVIGRIDAASTVSPIALSFASGHNPPRIGTAITIASLPTASNASVAGLWYRCDDNDANPPSTGCELVGSLTSYTPGAADLGHYLYAYIYYKDVGEWERASPGFTPQQVADVQRVYPWRKAGE